ncbi:MAG: hypothetical protein HY698_11215 [Deltaproteobacteria bacterium]|nr:hypothetical protein [Deltaproteobacteria bacterium]
MSTPRDLERRYLHTLKSWLVSLPHDLKVLFEAKDDPNLERPARETAAGAILYVLNTEPGEHDFVGFADDAILLREALRAVVQEGGEGAVDFKSRFEEHYATLDNDLTLCQEVMGETYTWLAGKIADLQKLVYKGKKVSQYLDDEEDSELLYEDGLAFATEYPIDEEQLSMRVKKAETILEPLRRRAASEKKKIA